MLRGGPKCPGATSPPEERWHLSAHSVAQSAHIAHCPQGPRRAHELEASGPARPGPARVILLSARPGPARAAQARRKMLVQLTVTKRLQNRYKTVVNIRYMSVHVSISYS